MKILVVEDSATLRFAMDSFIKDAGHETVIAENGEKAVQIVDQIAVDMIIMDVEMPGLNGFETTRLIRENLGENWIPIIFVTGKSEEKSLEEGIAVGGDDYLIKPVSNVILHAKIKAMERIANMRSQLHQLNDELTRLSQRDSLTNLYNRRTFEEKASEAWRFATRNKSPLTIMLFDIDYFKRYNDTYGHLAGDECIKHVATALETCFNRPGDIVARYGGEEFIVILPNTDKQGAEHMAEIIRAKIDDLSIEHRGSPEYGNITISIGASILKYTTGVKLKQQIDAADKSLYQSKHTGRNCATVNEFRNPNAIILIDESNTCSDETKLILSGHCELLNIETEKDIDEYSEKCDPKLIIVALKSENDKSIALYKKLRNRYHLTFVPLIFLSALRKSELKTVGKELGVSSSIEYPTEPNHLIAKINTFL